MGSIKQTYLKRIAEKLLGEYDSEFNTKFENNKKKVQEYCTPMGKGIRNKIAGYITKIKRQAEKAVS